MKKVSLILLLALAVTVCHAQRQEIVSKETADNDSVVFKTSVYYGRGKMGVSSSQYKAFGRFLGWAKQDTVTPIVVTGWTDRTGSAERNAKVSAIRARSIRNYLISKGLSPERISYSGRGVDTQAPDDRRARRVDMKGVVRMVAEVQLPPEPEPIPEPVPEPQPIPEPVPTPEPEPELEPVAPVIVSPPSPFYIGGGIGMAFGRGTFCSFAMDKTRAGFDINLFGGYKINKLFSTEVSLGYTRLKLGAFDCCREFWLASDGRHYYAPVAGMDNYSYPDLLSTVNLISLGVHGNVDLVNLWNDHSRWSVLVTPAIYGIYGSTNVKYEGAKVKSATAFYFGFGADLGVGYQLTDQIGLRLSSGITGLAGKAIDAMPKQEHKSNYLWTTGLKLIYKL